VDALRVARPEEIALRMRRGLRRPTPCSPESPSAALVDRLQATTPTPAVALTPSTARVARRYVDVYATCWHVPHMSKMVEVLA
jgi:hypothetical protein